MRLKKNIWKILLLAVVSCAGVFFCAGDTYAEDNFFYIKVNVQCSDENLGPACNGSYPVKVTKKNNGGYSVNTNSTLKSESLTIKAVGNKKLVVTIKNSNGCTGAPPGTISVDFNDDINKFRDSVNVALSSAGYTQSCSKLVAGASKTYGFGVGAVGEKAETTGDVGADGNTSCATSGALSSLGWILCPVLSLMSDTATTFYDEALVPFLTIEPELFTTGDNDNNVLAGWTVFQNIANVLFAILLLVVIFSQLTGVGINNYGIKKILPKLIVTAVLINLSYFICVLLVDVSNILGNSIQSLFDSLARGLDVTSAGNGGFGGFLSGMGATALTSAGVFVALLTATGGTVWGGAALAVSLLISGLGVLISLLFVFVILATRQAAAVVLIVISPLAVVCYALPNTKSLFDKWVKLMKAMLVLYPICGLLVGGGNYVSKLLLSTGMGDSFFGALTAMLAGIVPVFFIPTLAKSTLAGMGNLGAKIAGIGDKARGSITGAAKNSRFNQAVQKKGQMAKSEARVRRAEGLYEKDENGNLVPRKSGRFGRVGGAVLAARRTASGGKYGLGTEIQNLTKAEEEKASAERWAEAADKEGVNNLAEAARRNARARTGSAINETLGKSDSIGTMEKMYGRGATETSRLSAANSEIDKLKSVVGGNEAARSQQLDNLEAEGAKEKAAVVAAAKTGKLSSITKKNGYSDKQVQMANSLMKAHGDALTGKGTQEILSQMNDIRSSDPLEKVISAAQTGNLEAVISNANGNYTESQVKFAQSLRDQTGNSLKGKASQDIMNVIKGNGDLAAGAANLASMSLAADAALNATGQTEIQIQHGVDTSARSQLNQFVTRNAQETAGVAAITQSIADDRAKAARVAQDRKIWSDQLSRNNSATVSAALTSGLQNNDVAQVGAAFEILKDTGNLPTLFKVFDNPEVWDGLSDDMKLELNQDMIKSGDLTMATFAKENFKNNGKLNLAKFINGEPQQVGADDKGEPKYSKTLADYINDKGSHGLDGQDKDSIEQLYSHDRLSTMLSNISDTQKKQQLVNTLAKQVVSGYTTTQKGEEKTQFLNLLENYQQSLGGPRSDEYVNAMKKSISAAALAKMDTGIFEQLGDRRNDIIADALRDLQNPQNATLVASMSPSLKKKLDIGRWHRKFSN
jgi:hypothetical protein